MRPRLFLAVATLAAAATPLAAQSHGTLEKLVKQTVLPNGLRVVVVENHAVPIATAEIVIRSGAATQTPDEQGVPHLFEHMLFRGFGEGGEDGFRQRAARLHLGYNGTTSFEAVTYYLVGPSSAADQTIDLLATLMLKPRFTSDGLQTERSIVFGEFQRRLSDPRGVLMTEVERRLWGASYHRKNTIGEAVPLLAVKTKRLEELFRQWYVPGNAMLVVTGDVDATRVMTKATEKFGGWKTGPDPFAAAPVPPMEPLRESDAFVMEGDVSEITLIVEWQGPSVTREPQATYAADVFGDIANDDRSEFQNRLVQSGFFTRASIGYLTLAHTGTITFTGTTTLPKIEAALTALGSELESMASPGYYTDDDLAIAKKQRAVRNALAMEESPDLAHSIGHWWSVSSLDYWLDYEDNMANQTREDVARFVRTWVAGKPFVMGALASPKDAPALQKTFVEYLRFVKDLQATSNQAAPAVKP